MSSQQSIIENKCDDKTDGPKRREASTKGPTKQAGHPDTPLKDSFSVLEKAPAPIIIKFSITSIGVQKSIRCFPHETVWTIKKQLADKIGADIPDFLNHGLFLPGSAGKKGKFMDDKREFGQYNCENNTLIEVIPKTRQTVPSAGTITSDEPGSPSANNKKKQKSLILEIQRQNVEKVREKLSKGLDPNFWTEAEETPLSIAVMNNDKQMIELLIEAGAFLDYRVGSKETWKTPLHIAAQHNKTLALQTLISFGAWVNASDLYGATPLTFAVLGDHCESVHRLLLARADTDVCDENQKRPLHQACINGNEFIVGLLVDFGADFNAMNAAGNTPLHVAATRGGKGCVRYLMMRGANPEVLNKSGMNVVGAASANSEICEIVKGIRSDMLVPGPPKFVYTDKAEYPFSFVTPYGGPTSRMYPAGSRRASNPTLSSENSIAMVQLPDSSKRSTASKGQNNISASISKNNRDSTDGVTYETNKSEEFESKCSNGMLNRTLSRKSREKKISIPPPPSLAPPMPSRRFIESLDSEISLALTPDVNLVAALKRLLEGAQLNKSAAEVEGLVAGISEMEEALKKACARALKAEGELMRIGRKRYSDKSML